MTGFCLIGWSFHLQHFHWLFLVSQLTVAVVAVFRLLEVVRSHLPLETHLIAGLVAGSSFGAAFLNNTADLRRSIRCLALRWLMNVHCPLVEM